MSDKGMGSSVLRKEDFRFITGRGQYTDDISQPNQLYAYFLRSPVAHANLISVKTDQASSSPVLLLFIPVMILMHHFHADGKHLQKKERLLCMSRLGLF